jgi:hypothetical protein
VQLWVAMMFSLIDKSSAQYLDDSFYTLNFEDTFGLQHLIIDTNSDVNNIWEVGQPGKSIFTTAYSDPNVIITYSTESYPINDTSVFIIKNVVSCGAGAFVNMQENIMSIPTL